MLTYNCDNNRDQERTECLKPNLFPDRNKDSEGQGDSGQRGNLHSGLNAEAAVDGSRKSGLAVLVVFYGQPHSLESCMNDQRSINDGTKESQRCSSLLKQSTTFYSP